MLKNKRNKPTYESADKSLFVQNFKLSFVAVSQVIVKQTHQELKMYCTEVLEGKQIMAAEKMWYKSHSAYPPEIIQ